MACIRGGDGSKVLSVNDPPLANADEYRVVENETLTVPTPGVLENDSDVDGDELHILPGTNTLHGVLKLLPDGSFTYKPNDKFNREDAFTYVASDGTADSQPVTVQIIVDTAYPWYNGIRPLNVNDDGYISPLDALFVINELNANGSHKLSLDRVRPLAMPFFDVSRDGWVSPLDALMVINYLNGGGSGEGERPATIADAAPTPWIFVANSEMYDPGVGDMSGEEVEPVGVKVAISGPSASFLQTLDLLFAELDEAQGTDTREPDAGRKVTSTGDLEEFLDSMLDGLSDEEKLFANTAP